jgi:ATP synthase protein I
VIRNPDSRSSLSVGWDWGTRVTSIGLEFGLPAFLGYGLDRWWGTNPWMTVAGALLGIVMGMSHVLRLARDLPPSPGGRSLKKPSSTAPRDGPDDRV